MKISDIVPLHESVKTISKQEAIDRGMFGPVYHGTTPDRLDQIIQQGFKINGGEAGQRHGYQHQPYVRGGRIPAPIHHLGYGVYFTTVKAIAKQYNQGSLKGIREFYLDVPNLETINFASPNTMMRWWYQNGYNYKEPPDDRGSISYIERLRATVNLTKELSSKYDAVWFKGKTLYKVLDGDQVCVYDPSRIYMIDQKAAVGLEIGATVIHNQRIIYEGNDLFVEDGPGGARYIMRRFENYNARYRYIPPPGMKGVIVDRRKLGNTQYDPPDAMPHRSWLPPTLHNADYMYDVKWAKGGVQHNYYGAELDPVNPIPHQPIKQARRPHGNAPRSMQMRVPSIESS